MVHSTCSKPQLVRTILYPPVVVPAELATPCVAIGLRGGNLVQVGFNTMFSDLLQTELLARHGIVSDRHLFKQTRTGWFSLIVLDFDLSHKTDSIRLDYYLTQSARDAITSGYRVVGSLAVPQLTILFPQDRL